MSLDYPDYMIHVERTPIQKLPYQIYGVQRGEYISCSANSEASAVWNIPHDGYYYSIDTIFFMIDSLFPFTAFVDMTNDQNNPQWFTIAAARNNGCVEFSISRMGALALLYPSAIRFRIFNHRSVNIMWFYYCNFFKYQKEA